MTPSELSIVVPVLNEAKGIVAGLKALQLWRLSGAELIVVDGGSSDGTADLAAPLANRVIHSPKGRARQMNAGFYASKGSLLLFVHSDTTLPAPHLFCESFSNLDHYSGWGFFNVRLSGTECWCKVISAGMNMRSRITGIATGDQVLFVRRSLLDSLGGFPDLPLMEDIAICKQLKRQAGRGGNPHLVVETSSRRWRHHGVIKTVLLMWWLRLLFFAGVPASTLYRLYYPEQ